jgi:hypothetical protein
LSTAGATIDVASGIIKLNINAKEETFAFKTKRTEYCNQIGVSRGSTGRNAKTPRKNPNATKSSKLSYPIPRKRERSLHTGAQDVQITRIVTI